jgi:hypothetical protein
MRVMKERNAPKEYSNLLVSPTGMGRLPAMEGIPGMRSFDGLTGSLIKRGQSFADAFLVEGVLALGAAIGICLVAVLIGAGW